MRKWALVEIGWWMVLIVLVPGSLLAQEHVGHILIDGSGSMKGFFATDMGRLNARLVEALDSSDVRPKSLIFVTSGNQTRLVPFRQFLEQFEWGQETKLDDTFQLMFKDQVLVIVTDNVQDEGQEEYSSARSFYRLLEQKKVQAVALFPYRLPFRGHIYFPRMKYPNSETLLQNLRESNGNTIEIQSYEDNGKELHAIDIEGVRALAVYAIFPHHMASDRSKAIVRKIEDALNVPSILVKPIERKGFTINSEVQKDDAENYYQKLTEFCSLSREREKSFLMRPNFRLEDPITKNFKDSTVYYPLQPYRKEKERVTLGEPVQIRFFFRFIDGDSYVVLNRSSHDPCRTPITLILENINYDIPQRYKSLMKRSASIVKKIFPPFVPADAHANGLSNGISSPSIFLGQIRMEDLNVEQSIFTFLKLAFVRAIPLKINGSIHARVPVGAFKLAGRYNDRFFTNSEFEIGKIYTPEDIISYVSVEPEVIQFNFKAENILLSIPIWIRLMVIGPIVFILLLTFYIFLNMIPRHYLKLVERGRGTVFDVRLPWPFQTKFYIRNQEAMFVVKRSGLFSRTLTPGAGYQLYDAGGNPLRKVKLSIGMSVQVEGEEVEKGVLEVISDSEIAKGNFERGQLCTTKKRKEQKVNSIRGAPSDGTPTDWDSDIDEAKHLFGED